MQQDKRKAKLQKVRQKQASKKSAELPMNKDFINASNAEGERKYPLAEKLIKWKMKGIDEIQDEMRQIAAYIDNIKHYQSLTRRYKVELKSGVITSKDKNGIMDEPGLKAAISSNKINEYRQVNSIRDHITNKLLIMISETFTGEMFNDYVLKVEKSLKKLGYELLPEEMEIIYPE